MLFREPKNNGLDCRLFGSILNINDECPFHNLIDLYIVELSPGEAVMEIPAQEEHLNPMGAVHGGLIFSLADAVMGFAIRTLNIVSVTVEANINYLKPVYKSDTLTAIGKVIQSGNSIAVAEGLIKNKAGETVAVARGTYYNTSQFLDLPEHFNTKSL
ncbi:MAG: PaaI family thioesterase [Clostridia bacterium]|nr:PaaI family thioesterase [Clostridia bacterium]